MTYLVGNRFANTNAIGRHGFVPGCGPVASRQRTWSSIVDAVGFVLWRLLWSPVVFTVVRYLTNQYYAHIVLCVYTELPTSSVSFLPPNPKRNRGDIRG